MTEGEIKAAELVALRQQIPAVLNPIVARCHTDIVSLVLVECVAGLACAAMKANRPNLQRAKLIALDREIIDRIQNTIADIVEANGIRTSRADSPADIPDGEDDDT